MERKNKTAGEIENEMIGKALVAALASLAILSLTLLGMAYIISIIN